MVAETLLVSLPLLMIAVRSLLFLVTLQQMTSPPYSCCNGIGCSVVLLCMFLTTRCNLALTTYLYAI